MNAVRLPLALRFAGPLIVGALIGSGAVGLFLDGGGPRPASAGSPVGSGRTVVTKPLPPLPASSPAAADAREPMVRGRLPEAPAAAPSETPDAAGKLPEEAAAPPPPPPSVVQDSAASAAAATREIPSAGPPPPESAPPVVAAPPEPRPFSLLVESLRRRENALAAQRSWRQRGLNPYLVQAELGEKGTWWRLLLGAYRSLPEALAARRELGIGEAVPVKTPFGNLAGEFSDPQEAALLRERIAARGWDAYLLEDPGRPLRLVVGAFADAASAEKQRRELAAQGIETRTVRR